MPNRLRDLRIDEVSLVDKGANQHAHVPIFKLAQRSALTVSDTAVQLTLCAMCGDSYEVHGEDVGMCPTCRQSMEAEGPIYKLLKAILGNGLAQKLRQSHASLAEEDNTAQSAEGDDDMPTPIDKSALPAEVQAHITDLEEKVTKALADLEEAKKATPETPVAKAEEAEDIWKGVSPALREIFEKTQARAEEAETAIRLEKAAREEREMVAKVRTDYAAVPGTTPEALAKALLSVPAESRAEIEKSLAAANEALKTGETFREIGKSGGGDSAQGAVGKVTQLAKARQQTDGKISYDQAVVKVLEENPALYEQYVAESQRGVN